MIGVEPGSLVDQPPYASRNDARFLAEMEQLTQHHLAGCPLYQRIWSQWRPGGSVQDLPFLHAGLFKRLLFRTEGLAHERTLESSSTTGSQPSQIVLDKSSSQLQARSALAILKDFVGEKKRPLLILDDGKSLRQKRGSVSARMVAAMSLSPLATALHFLLVDATSPATMKWEEVRSAMTGHDELLVYGFTSMLWLAWAAAEIPQEIRQLLASRRIHFVHSGGWKTMESLQVSPEEFDRRLTQGLAAGSRVVDYYGLVEQVGIIYPLCECKFRHVPVWADVHVRDPLTLESIEGRTGQLQLMNTLAQGAPYHSVLTEDMGVIVPGACPCGRAGKRFELVGRMPKAEVRGCANV